MSVKQLQSLSRQPRAIDSSSFMHNASALDSLSFTSWAAAIINLNLEPASGGEAYGFEVALADLGHVLPRRAKKPDSIC